MTQSAPPTPDLAGKLPVPDFLDTLFDCPEQRRMTPGYSYVPRSEWLERETREYSALLAKERYSWLIVPVQTQGYGFDRIERALMSAEIADAFASQGQAPGTPLVARALGEVRRTYALGAIGNLGNALGVTRALEAYAGHDGAYRMTLTLLLRECRKGVGCSLIKQHDWRNLPFTDERPPFTVIRAMRAELLREMVGATAPAPTKSVEPAAPAGAGAEVQDVIAGHSRLGSAAVSTVLATLSPSDDQIGRERLHEIALRNALRAGTSAENRVLAAYAAFQLQRRPYALSLIDGLNDPAAVTLRELLNGNLPEAQQRIAQVKPPVPKLILSIALQDLRVQYGRKGVFDDATASAVLSDRSQAWRVLIGRRVGDLDTWSTADSVTPKMLLDAAFPIQGQELETIMKGALVVGRGELDEKTIGDSSLRHLHQVLSKLHPADCCSPAPGAAWQVYWLVESIIESNVLKSARHQLVIQGVPQSAQRVLDDYQPYFGGQPDFEALRSRVAYEVAKRETGERAKMVMRQGRQSDYSAAYWSQGQNNAALTSALGRGDFQILRFAYTADFPGRSFWQSDPMLPNQGIAPCAFLRYAVADPFPAAYCLTQLPPAARSQLAADFATRFHGNAAAPEFLKSMLGVAPSADPIADLRAAISQDPESYGNYLDLGMTLIRRDANYVEAQKAFLSYPDFKERQPDDPVAVSNGAFDMGSELYWRGQHELARPLYEIAANLRTGSGATMTSAMRLALLDGDFEEATAIAQRRGARYPNTYSFRDYFSLLYVTGRKPEADAGFAQIATSFANPQAWLATLVDQRMQSMSYEQVKAWLMSEDVREARYRGRHFAPVYALWWATTDRAPPADFPRLMAQIERGEERHMEFDGLALTRPDPEESDQAQFVRPSAFREGKSPKLPADSNGPSEYVLLADALTATHAGNYAGAVQKFTALADRYPIESEDTEVALSYFALASAKTGDKLGLERFIEALPQADRSFDVWMARAFFAAVRHEPDKAMRALQRGFGVKQYTESRPLVIEYQFAEACEIVLRETGDARFVPMIVDWAKRNQKIQPMTAWPYAMEAAFSKNPVDVNRALALTLYLDPASPRMRNFDGARIAAARAWLKANNPFLKSVKRRPKSPGI